MEMTLTFCQSCKNVIYIISTEGWSLHMLYALTPRKLICIVLRNSVVHNIALVSGQDNWSITANLMDQFFVPVSSPLKWVFIRHIVYEQCTYKQSYRSVSQTKEEVHLTYLRRLDNNSWQEHGTFPDRLYPKQRAWLVSHRLGSSFRGKRRRLSRIAVCRINHGRT